VKKRFDSVSWMRAMRERIHEEDGKLSREGKPGKAGRLLEKDPLWIRLRKRIVDPKRLPYAEVMEPREK